MSDTDYDRIYLQKAIKTWLRAIKRDDKKFSIADMMEFGQLIGHPHNMYHEGGKIIDTNNPDVRRIIDLINSENGKTIVRVLIARNVHED